MRYKEFNRNKVLDQCISLFWKNGFNSCSINEIVRKTGVNRFSLYNEFHNKEGILYSALELYHVRYFSENLAVFSDHKALQDTFIDFFSSLLLKNGEHPPGCFIIHIGTELADSDPKVKLTLEIFLQKLEAIFISILQLHEETKSNRLFFARHLIGLFCTSMCFCVIQSHEERISHVSNGINIILSKK